MAFSAKKNGRIFFEEYTSTDGFIYFRCWLLLKGKDFFDDITKDINAFNSGKYSFNIGDVWAEGLLYAAEDAYSVHNENEDESEIRDAVSAVYPDVIHYDSLNNKLDRKPLSGNEIHIKYPELVDEIIDLRRNPT